jgi:hypothetical protein
MLALYASGNGTPSTAPADFASAYYHTTPSNSSPVIAHEV